MSNLDDLRGSYEYEEEENAPPVESAEFENEVEVEEESTGGRSPIRLILLALVILALLCVVCFFLLPRLPFDIPGISPAPPLVPSADDTPALVTTDEPGGEATEEGLVDVSPTEEVPGFPTEPAEGAAEATTEPAGGVSGEATDEAEGEAQLSPSQQATLEAGGEIIQEPGAEPGQEAEEGEAQLSPGERATLEAGGEIIPEPGAEPGQEAEEGEAQLSPSQQATLEAGGETTPEPGAEGEGEPGGEATVTPPEGAPTGEAGVAAGEGTAEAAPGATPVPGPTATPGPAGAATTAPSCENNEPPVADANGPYQAMRGKGQAIVNFDGSGSTDSDGSIDSYEWDFGDGTATETGETVTHGYTSTGGFVATLTVTDNCGATSMDTADVTIVGPTPPSMQEKSNDSNEDGESKSDTSQSSQGSNVTEAAVVQRASVSGTDGFCHRVQYGDTLYGIAWNYGVSIADLSTLNLIEQDYLVIAGQGVFVPTGEISPGLNVYRVQTGDTLNSIAYQCGLKVSNLAKVNHLNLDASLTPGQVIAIPPWKY